MNHLHSYLTMHHEMKPGACLFRLKKSICIEVDLYFFYLAERDNYLNFSEFA
jgi:hypothetical protein